LEIERAEEDEVISSAGPLDESEGNCKYEEVVSVDAG
jgi:hypothetical protein